MVSAGVLTALIVGVGGAMASSRSGDDGARDAAPSGTATTSELMSMPEGEDVPSELTPPVTAHPAPSDMQQATDGTPREDEPASDDIPASGPGTYSVAAADGAPAPGAITYTVEVEDGLPFDVDEAADFVSTVLNDDRSWHGVSGQTFSRVAENPDLRILISTPGTTDQICYPLQTAGEVSCRSGNTVALNANRWAFAVPHFNGELIQYRTYVVNHEVGHYLGHGHEYCPGPGQPAPVMQQQTYGLQGCVANAWPSVG